MKAITLVPGTTQVALVDWPEPNISRPDEVKLRVLAVGVCGTDRDEISGGRSAAPKGDKVLIIGHEMLGEVVEVGSAVKTVKKGDLAVVSVRRGCGACIECNQGHEDMCSTGNYKERGIKELDGFQSEYVVDFERYLMKVPRSLRNIGVLTEPMSVVQKAITEALDMQRKRFCDWDASGLHKKKAIVVGLGPIGLLALVILRLRGMDVYGVGGGNFDAHRIELLKRMGAHYINGREMTPEMIVKSYGEMDFIIEATGRAELCFGYMSVLGINGIYSLVSVPEPGDSITLDAGRIIHNFVMKNQVLLGSVNAQKANWIQGIVDLEAAQTKWGDTVEQFITSKFPYAEYKTAMTSRVKGDIKTVIEWGYSASTSMGALEVEPV